MLEQLLSSPQESHKWLFWPILGPGTDFPREEMPPARVLASGRCLRQREKPVSARDFPAGMRVLGAFGRGAGALLPWLGA